MAPSVLILVAANLLPIVGVVFWGWDAFVLLMLYWLETAVIGFWTIVRIATDPVADGSRRSIGGIVGGLAMAAFFTVHAGIFMTVHFLFLWTLFSGGWSRRIHDVGDFVRDMVIGTGLWLPLLVLFLVRGGTLLWPHIRGRLGFDPRAGEAIDRERGYIFGLYARIVVMQVTILAGAWFALQVASVIVPLVLLVLLKTGVDLVVGPVAARLQAGMAKAAARPGTGN